jgi:hypothetical protein
MSLTDYSHLEDQIEDAEDFKILPAGTEVEARIIGINTGVSEKNDCRWFMPLFDIPDEPMAAEFNDFFWDLDKDKLDEKAFARSLSKFKKFAKAFDVDFSRPFDWDDLVGSTGWVILGIRKDEEYGDKNKVNKYVMGR